MKKVDEVSAQGGDRALGPRHGAQGFTLIELMVAMLVFLVVAGTAFSVFNEHMKLVTHQENLSAVNLALRNATSELQMDLSGAGQNLLGTLGNFSTGVVIQNNVPGTAAACTPTGADYRYPVPSACFDSLTIFGPHPGCAATGGQEPPVLVMQDPNGPQEDVSANVNSYGADPKGPNAADAGCFKNGDEVLVIEVPINGQALPCPLSFCISAVTLTADGAFNAATGLVQLQHTLTAGNGGPAGCPGAGCTDPQGVIYNPNANGGTNFVQALWQKFSNNNTYFVDIGGANSAITYSVVKNPQNPDDTQLQRCDSNGCAVLADQVVGFKVGAALWNNEQLNQPDIANYFFDSSQYCSDWFAGANCNGTPPTPNDPYDFSLIRAVRVSMVGRTPPQEDPTIAKFANGFDGGPYLVQQSSVVVDLRNMSIGDFQN
jgi:prepilin-type N-terminal cleavage/methylation domain-containing protein